jgi:multiple sugar transport system permease protein
MMTFGRSDNPIKRYIVHALMVFFGLLAVVPIYVLLINSTRTNEQINTGLSIIPGRGAFSSRVEDSAVLTKTREGEVGTIRFKDVLQGVTYTNDGYGKRIVYSIPEGMEPSILIVDDDNDVVATYALPKGVYIEVDDGENARHNHVLYKSYGVTAETGGTVKFVDFVPGTTSDTLNSTVEEKDKSGNIISRRIDEYFAVKPIGNTLRPVIRIMNKEMTTAVKWVDGEEKEVEEEVDVVSVSYLVPGGSYLEVKDGDKVEEGQVLVRKVKKPVNILYNWRALINRGFKIFRGFLNSSVISLGSTLLCIYFSALTAYGLHVYRFRGRLAMWVLILIIMMLPGSLTFIGFYQLMATWGLTDSYIPLIMPSIAAAGAVLFIRQYMMSVLSVELIDAARIDGAGEYRIFNVIILPVIVPALAAQAIFSFVGSWNNFLAPFVLIQTEDKFTLPMFVFLLRGDIYRTELGGLYLGIAISLIPIIVFYAFMSRFIISGLTMGGLKE